MKTFFKSILAVAVCASLFAACSKDDTVSDTVLSDMDAVFSELRAVRELGEQIRNAWGDEGGSFTEADYAQASGLVTRLSLSNYQLRTLMNTGESDFESLYQ